MIVSKKHPLFAVWLGVFVLSAGSSAWGALPDAVGEWRAAPARVTELKTGSGVMGVWENRVYSRAAPRASAEADLTEGPGFGTLYAPPGQVSANDAPIGFGSVYETLSAAGKSAILEEGEGTGRTVAVALG
ncbi:MAG: hypothetical protein LBL51_06745, partial [Synergistaceae bacterium]|nr:hypothetical protein [Synergistaceae bacterium]